MNERRGLADQRGLNEQRISVTRDNRVVPLIPTDGVRRKVAQPWRGILLERHTVGAIEIPEHVHGEFCVHLQVKGGADFEWWSEGRNRVEKTGPGSMILLGPGTRDRLHWEGTSERLIVSMQPELMAAVAGGAAVDVRNQWALRDGAVEYLVAEMGREAEAGWPLGGLYADLLGVGLARTLVRRHGEGVAAGEAEGQISLVKLRRVMSYMTERVGEDLRLGEVAGVAGLSEFHFAREFKKSVGQTAYQYLLDQRMELAKRLLKSGRWSVAEVGVQCGFGSAVNFVRAFKQRVGVTPGGWRG